MHLFVWVIASSAGGKFLVLSLGFDSGDAQVTKLIKALNLDLPHKMHELHSFKTISMMPQNFVLNILTEFQKARNFKKIVLLKFSIRQLFTLLVKVIISI